MTNLHRRWSRIISLLHVGLLAVVPASSGSAPATAPQIEGSMSSNPMSDLTQRSRLAKYVPPTSGVSTDSYIASLLEAFKAPAHQYGPGHRGVDSPMDSGATVSSPGAGVVSFAGNVAGRPLIVILHDDGLRSTLEPVVSELHPGERVAQGTQLGVLHEIPTHCDSGTCLHWGVRLPDDSYLDPLSLLVRPQIILLPTGVQ